MRKRNLILLIEEKLPAREALKATFEKLGYEVHAYEKSKKMLEDLNGLSAENAERAIIVSCWGMRSPEGPAVAEEARDMMEKRELPKIPFLLRVKDYRLSQRSTLQMMGVDHSMPRLGNDQMLEEALALTLANYDNPPHFPPDPVMPDFIRNKYMAQVGSQHER